MNEAFLQASTIISTLEKDGHEAYIVGGSVRDHILNRDLGDIDIATSATPTQIQALFPKTIDVGAEHGTIIVVTDNDSYEVTTFRTEGSYSDNRRPDEVTFVKSLKEDLRRRDFTMNAIAMTKEGKILDPFCGTRDIEHKLIRTVGEASERFSEDALRMFRALRFSSQLSFSVHSKTLEAIQLDAHLMQHISVERKTVELEKLLIGQGMTQALSLLVESNLFLFLPLLADKKEELIKLSEFPLHTLTSREELWTTFVYMLKVEEVERFLTAWKLPKRLSKSVQEILHTIQQFQKQGWHQELVYRSGWNACLAAHHVLLLLELDKSNSYLDIKRLFEELPIYNLQDIAINGNDLVEWLEKKPGKWIAEVLQEIESELLQGNIENEAVVLKEWVRTWQQKLERNC
ncbi:CCA tRNA nucleotidyltransferase [Sutcliffiella halmapala]|uniref:CCA tRNA nucleotidyltransferase n=1 Tax=Sutcliffiella halmapala TaxID=79882 RepID=UPI0009958201|nr:CCA tRNA nucleotidyltransferase [Sutcliffiella halmapala]